MSNKGKLTVLLLLCLLGFTIANVAFYSAHGFMPDNPVQLTRWVFDF